jgi:hypothetical protein
VEGKTDTLYKWFKHHAAFDLFSCYLTISLPAKLFEII